MSHRPKNPVRNALRHIHAFKTHGQLDGCRVILEAHDHTIIFPPTQSHTVFLEELISAFPCSITTCREDADLRRWLTYIGCTLISAVDSSLCRLEGPVPIFYDHIKSPQDVVTFSRTFPREPEPGDENPRKKEPQK